MTMKRSGIGSMLDRLVELPPVLDGDFRRCQGVYANMIEPDDFQPKGKFEELGEQMSMDFDGIEFCSIEDFVKVIRDGAHVIECGFLP